MNTKAPASAGAFVFGADALFTCARCHLCTVVCAGTPLPVELWGLAPCLGEKGHRPDREQDDHRCQEGQQQTPGALIAEDAGDAGGVVLLLVIIQLSVSVRVAHCP